MQHFKEKIEYELRRHLQKRFHVAGLYDPALACVEYKMQESLLFGKMTVLHYRMFSGTGELIYQAAAAVELMILALDMIDDLQDQDNDKVVWSQFPPPITMNIAIGFLTLAEDVLLECDFPTDRIHEAARMMNQQVLTAINGQTIDLLNHIEDEDDYIQMVEQKSAALLVFACQVGTILATGERLEQVGAYAQELGIAAQMKNDMKDLTNWNHKNDFWNRKKTLATLYLLQSVSKEDNWIIDYYEGRLATADVLSRKEELEKLIESSGTMLYTSVRMRTHYYRYLELLDQMGVEPHWREQMLEMSN